MEAWRRKGSSSGEQSVYSWILTTCLQLATRNGSSTGCKTDHEWIILCGPWIWCHHTCPTSLYCGCGGLCSCKPSMCWFDIIDLCKWNQSSVWIKDDCLISNVLTDLKCFTKELPLENFKHRQWRFSTESDILFYVNKEKNKRLFPFG